MGAESFHGPVRDGKGWVQLAMGVKLKGVTAWWVTGDAPTTGGRVTSRCYAVLEEVLDVDCVFAVLAHAYAWCELSGAMRRGRLGRIDLCRALRHSSSRHVVLILMRVSYRIKPYESLVSVSSTCYHASTPDLSTSWS
jgi:hypothetical protein